MNLFDAITLLKLNKEQSQSLIKNGVISGSIFNEYDIYSRVMKAVAMNQSKSKAVVETAQIHRVSERYVWKILRKFTESSRAVD